MERMRLVYKDEELNEVELPFRILVLGDFSGNEESSLVPIEINKINFDLVMASLNLNLSLSLNNHLSQGNDLSLDIDLSFEELESFSPDSIVYSVPELNALINLKQLLIKASPDLSLIDQKFKETGIFSNKLVQYFREDRDEAIDFLVAEIDYRLSKQLDQILHHPDFQKLESAWRSLYYLVKQVIPGENCEIDLFNISSSALRDDFDNSGDIFDSLLYKIVYSDELGQFGGKPYSVLIANYNFGLSKKDLKLLENCGEVAKLSHAPFVAGIKPSLLGFEDFTELAKAQDLNDIFEKAPKWAGLRSLREKDLAQYIGLTLPAFLLRELFHYKKDNIKSFSYQEGSDYLWANASFAFAACMLRSFVKYRWPLDVIGPEGGIVPDVKFERSGPSGEEALMPLPVLISEQKESDLTKMGLIPLSYQRGNNSIFFQSANSIQVSAINTAGKAEIDNYLAAQLPYLFIICRLVHYIKVIQRDNIGTSKDIRQLEEELNEWLVQYVSDMENPSLEVRTRRPLRKARIEVSKKQNTNLNQLHLKIVPHLRYMGAAFSLSIQGKL